MNKSEFPKKYYDKIKDTPFVEEMESADIETLKSQIVQCEQNIYEIDKEKEKDEKLNSAKSLVKEYSASYNEAAAFQKAKVKFCLFVLESRGASVSSEEDDK